MKGLGNIEIKVVSIDKALVSKKLRWSLYHFRENGRGISMFHWMVIGEVLEQLFVSGFSPKIMKALRVNKVVLWMKIQFVRRVNPNNSRVIPGEDNS